MGFPKFIWAQNSFLYRASPVISDLQTEFWNIGKGKDEIFSLLSAPPPAPSRPCPYPWRLFEVREEDGDYLVFVE